jgi:outer membrane autotransporter protein
MSNILNSSVLPARSYTRVTAIGQRLLLSAAIAALVCGTAVQPVAAQAVTGSGDLTGGLTSPSWTVGGDLIVGDTGTGTLSIANGGTVSNDNGFLGNQASGNGTVTVSGRDGLGNASTWTNNGDLVLGQSGTGRLNITGGGTVSNQSGYVGATGTGNATVSGTDSNGHASTWTNAFSLLVGDAGVGTLSVLAGGVVNSADGTIGNQLGSNGAVTVSGSDGLGHVSTWTSTNQFYIGLDGTGTLNILGGGVVNSGQGLIGGTTGSTSNGVGTVAVSGTDGQGHASAWTAANNIYVGFLGAGTLNIADGGTVSTSAAGGGAASIYIGLDNGSTGTVTISSSTADISTLTATDRIEVGVAGTGALTIDNGGLVHAGSDTYVTDAGGSSGTLNLLEDSNGRGVLETGSVVNGNGAGILNLNGGVLRATRDEANFLNGFAALTIGSNGAWFDTNGHDITVGTAFSGPSDFNKMGLGTLTLTGVSSYTGGSTISAGTLQLGNGGTTGSIVGNVTDNGALAFNRSDNGLVLGGVISGNGMVSQIGSGTTILTGANTYTGGTTISAGTLQLGNGGTSGAITGNVADSGTLAFNRSDAVTFAGVISGSGAVRQIGTGSTTLTGVNVYSGGTVVSGGTLVGSATSFGSGAILDNAALIINQPTAADFANAINGTGSLVKQGAGRLNYTGTGLLSGPTTVAAGLLSVNGSLANSAVTVRSGATLGGNGTIGATTVLAGGIIAPGNSIGTLHVNSAYSQSAGSVYQVQVDPNSNASDLIAVNGAATLAPGAGLSVSKAVPGIYSIGTVYKVLTATNGVTGTYTLSGDTALSPYLGLKDKYDANNAYLIVTQTADPAGVASTPNQTQTATGTGSLPDNSGVGSAVLNTPDPATTRSAFDQLAGETLASAKSALVSGSLLLRDTALDRLRDVYCTTDDPRRPDNHMRNAACLPDLDKPAVWAQGFGSWGNIGSDGNAASMSDTTGGFLVGVDIPAYDWRLGYFGGFSRTYFSVKARNSSGNSNNYHLGVYGGARWGDLGLRLGISYSWNDLATDRSVTVGTLHNDLHANYNAGTTQVFGELGQRFDFEQFTFEPFASVAYVNLRTGGFSETGGDAALTAKADRTEDTFTTLGVRPSTDISWGTFNATARGMAGWRHAFGDAMPRSTVSFAGSDAFTVAGAPIAQDAGVVEAGLDFAVRSNVTASLTYGGQFGVHETDHSIRGTVAITF